MKGAGLLARRLPDFCLLLFVAAATVGAFTGGLWASLGIGGAIVMFAAVWRIEGSWPRPRPDVAFLALLVLGVCAILNFQSSQPAVSWRLWLQMASIFLPLCLLSSPDIQRRILHAKFFPVLGYAAIAGALALGIELFLGGPLLQALRGPVKLSEYNRGFSHLILLAFPVMAGLYVMKRRVLLAALVLALLLPAVFTESRASMLALALGLATVAVARLWPHFSRRILMLAPLAAAAWPFAAQSLYARYHGLVEHLTLSWHARVEIWDCLSFRILERPWFGWGLGAAPTLSFASPHTPYYSWIKAPIPHPHNAIIQLWVELGLPGLALGIAFMLLMLRLGRRLDPRIAPFALGAWVAGFCFAMVAYSLWTDSLWSAFALTGLAFALLQKRAADA